MVLLGFELATVGQMRRRLLSIVMIADGISSSLQLTNFPTNELVSFKEWKLERNCQLEISPGRKFYIIL